MFNYKTLILIALVVFGLSVHAFNKYSSTLVENGRISYESEVLKDNSAYNDWSNGITNEVLKEYMVDKIDVITNKEQTRTEAIDEYIKDVDIPRKPEGANPSARDSSADVRVAKLANRMLDYYCSARPEDTRCNTSNASNPVSH